MGHGSCIMGHRSVFVWSSGSWVTACDSLPALVWIVTDWRDVTWNNKITAGCQVPKRIEKKRHYWRVWVNSVNLVAGGNMVTSRFTVAVSALCRLEFPAITSRHHGDASEPEMTTRVSELTDSQLEDDQRRRRCAVVSCRPGFHTTNWRTDWVLRHQGPTRRCHSSALVQSTRQVITRWFAFYVVGSRSPNGAVVIERMAMPFPLSNV